MNETILELILTAVMGFFMVLGLVGCHRQKREAEKNNKKLDAENGASK